MNRIVIVGSDLDESVSRLTSLTGRWPVLDGQHETRTTNPLQGEPALVRQLEVRGCEAFLELPLDTRQGLVNLRAL